jgi:hypothetical protein
MVELDRTLATQVRLLVARVTALELEVSTLRRLPRKQNASLAELSSLERQPIETFAEFAAMLNATDDDMEELAAERQLGPVLARVLLRALDACPGAAPAAARRGRLWVYCSTGWEPASDDDLADVVASLRRSLLTVFQAWSERNTVLLEDDRRNAEYYKRLRLLMGGEQTASLVRRHLARTAPWPGAD